MYSLDLENSNLQHTVTLKKTELKKMEFAIGSAELLNISDSEISELLAQVYVDGGFTEPELAVTLFAPDSVRKRGLLIGAREQGNATLAGMVILVPPESPARRLAQDNEAEMHLLGVKPDFRQCGLGKFLVQAAMDQAKQSGYAKIVLWTQKTMYAAQRLYESMGFVRIKAIHSNGRDFWLYEREL